MAKKKGEALQIDPAETERFRAIQRYAEDVAKRMHIRGDKVASTGLIFTAMRMLNASPETWTVIDRDKLTAEEDEAFDYLHRAQFIEYRATYRFKLFGTRAVKCRLTTTGTVIKPKDFEPLMNMLWAVQGEVWKSYVSREDPVPSATELVGNGEWRRGRNGFDATDDVASGKSATVIDWIFLPGPPQFRQMPGGEAKAEFIDVEGDSPPAPLPQVRVEEVSPAVLEMIRKTIHVDLQDDPFTRWLRGRPNQPRRIIGKLYAAKNLPVSDTELRIAGWDEPPEDDAFKKAMSRCQGLFNESRLGDPHHGYVISERAGSWVLCTPV